MVSFAQIVRFGLVIAILLEGSFLASSHDSGQKHIRTTNVLLDR